MLLLHFNMHDIYNGFYTLLIFRFEKVALIIVMLLAIVFCLYGFSDPPLNAIHSERNGGRKTSVTRGRDGATGSVSVMESALKWLLPTNTSQYSCDNIPVLKTPYSRSYLQQKSKFHAHMKKIRVWIKEGHTGMKGMESQYKFYHHIAQEPWVNVICETGFNAGHSAFQWLASSRPSTRLFSFDMCVHDYTQPMADYLKATFPGRLHLTCGDSGKTLPLATDLTNKCDLIVVDGGHTYDMAYKDLVNFKKLANSDHHLLIFDDAPGIPEEEEAWNEIKKKNIAREIFQCLPDAPTTGVTIGTYNL